MSAVPLTNDGNQDQENGLITDIDQSWRRASFKRDRVSKERPGYSRKKDKRDVKQIDDRGKIVTLKKEKKRVDSSKEIGLIEINPLLYQH